MIKSDDYRNGYINATKLCKDGGKKYNDWFRLDNSKELIEYYEHNSRHFNYELKIAENTINNLISGTYCYMNIK